jgi:hypothetical protein
MEDNRFKCVKPATSALSTARMHVLKVSEDVELVTANGASMGQADFRHLKWQTEVRFKMVIEHLVDAIRDLAYGEVISNDDMLRDLVNDYGLNTTVPLPEFTTATLDTLQTNQVMAAGKALTRVDMPEVLHTVFSDVSKLLKETIAVQQRRALLLELMWKVIHAGYAIGMKEDMLDMLLDSWVIDTGKLVALVNELAASLPLFYAKGQKVILAAYRRWAPSAFAFAGDQDA